MSRSDQVSTLFAVLADPARRVVMYYLSEHPQASLDTLTSCVTGWVQSGPGADLSTVPREYETIRLRLHHVHLPKMEGAGYLEYDRDSARVTAGDLPSGADSVLEAAVAADTGDGSVDVADVLEAIDETDD